ncbi:BnaCnng54750D [Brassica napus]|uniref:BnaCnng54750D protein n=1 Tax=Brassica napus TaxID=3708 RepID=A0A078JNV9_BRANA|nr:BnaCnng54750D [Brassica napus]
MGETTKGDATKPSPNQISSPKDSSLDHQTPTPSPIHHHHQSFHPSPIFIATVSSPGAPIIPKRPRFISSSGLSPPQWKALPSPSTLPTAATFPSLPSPSTTVVAASSTETAASSPLEQEGINTEKQQLETDSFQHKFRKGKYVSPVWKPHEMLWLAKAWRVQYQKQETGPGSGSGEGRGKTRAEKDRELGMIILNIRIHTTLTIPSSSSSLKDLRRIGKIRLTWEESVNLWAEEGEVDYGRIRVSGSSFLNADELTYLDDSIVACTMESFDDGPLRGFSLDKFISGQHLKVFGRQKSTSSSAPSPSVNMANSIDRAQLPLAVPINKSISTLEFQDPSEHYLSSLRVPAANPPSLFELGRYLQEPPPENLRFPIRRDVYKDLPPGKELFFSTSTTELLDCRAVTYDIISPVMFRLSPNSVISSKDSLIPLWDDCVNRMVSKFCDMVWPNVVGFVKGFGLWRGEEVEKVREGAAVPSSLLVKKILWSYDDLPYILGYHAIGFTVTFCALSRSSQDRVVCTDLYSFDVSSPSDRIKALVPCYRLASLLHLLADRCTMRHLCYNDFERISHRDFVTEITPNTVTKYYSSKRKWSVVKGIYDFLDQRVPHAEHLNSAREKELSLSFKPRGVRVKPCNVDHLIESLMCVTRALVALHDLSFMHRDMRWENVMRSAEMTTTTSDAEWFVCGFDEAAESPQLNPHRSMDEEEEEENGRQAPEMERGLHAVKVDVWGVGYMIKTCGLTNVPKMLRELQGKCLEPNQENRPTAADCFHHLLQVQSASSSSY